MNQTKSKMKILRKSFYEGIVMAVVAYGGAMLLGSSVKKVIGYLMFAAVILGLLDYLCFHLIKEKKRKFRIVITTCITVMNVMILLSVTIYHLGPMLLFYTNSSPEAYEALMSYENTESITVKSSQGNLTGWMLHNAEDGAPLIIFFHGNGENASKRMNRIIEEQRTSMYEGYNIVIISYPGYENSEGEDSEQTLKEMGLCVYDAMSIREDVDSNKIYLMGYSLGTGVANYVASQRKVAGMVLLAPYSNGYDIFNNVLPVFYGPLRYLVSFSMEAEEFARKVTIKPLILASRIDESVPYASSLNLSEQYFNGCDFRTFTGFGHNEFFDQDEVKSVITKYFKEELEP